MLQTFEKIPVRICAWICRIHLAIQTWHIELVFVAIVLVVVGIISGKGLVEWIGIIAVLFNFAYVQIADRLEEREAKRYHIDKKVEVHCYWKLKYYFYAKEISFFAYFFLLHAWAALVGVFIFLLYPIWRKAWRKYHPLDREIV